MSDRIELEGRIFVPASNLDIPEWGCVVNDRNQPTLTLKDDDLFLITDTLGNISGCSRDETIASMGLFCRDTRFLSRLELQVGGRSPILLTSNADKGFALSALCTNPSIPDINAETISIQREIVLNGGLFEELTIHNYNTKPISFELSLSFDADFSDLFEIRGFHRKQRGNLLRRVPAERHDAKNQPVTNSIEELTLAYQGLDEAILESYIQFLHLRPNYLKGYTAIWEIQLESHASCQLGYRLQMLMNNRSVSGVHVPSALLQAKAAELMEEDHWRSLRSAPIIPRSIAPSSAPNKIFTYCVKPSIASAPVLVIPPCAGKCYRLAYPGFVRYSDGMRLLLPVRSSFSTPKSPAKR